MTLSRQGGTLLALCLLGWCPTVPSIPFSPIAIHWPGQDAAPPSLREQLRSSRPGIVSSIARRLYLDRRLDELLLALPHSGWSRHHPIVLGLEAGGLEIARDLIPFLGDDDEDLRQAALRLLLVLEADEALVQGLHSPGQIQRATAREGLRRMGSEALPRLIEELPASDRDFRREALTVLLEMGSMAADGLGILLVDGAFFDEVSPILIGYGRVGFESILDQWPHLGSAQKQSLLEQFGSRRERSRALLLGIVRFGSHAQALCAVDILRQQRDASSLVEALRLARTSVKTRALSKLIELGKPAIPDIARALRDGDPEVRRLASKSLQDLGPPAYPILAGLLQDGDPALRLEAVIFLIEAGSPGLEALGKAQSTTQGRSLPLLHPSLRKQRRVLIPKLLASLESRRPMTIHTSLGLLAALDAWHELAGCIGDDDASLRAPLRETLISGGPAAVPAILDELARNAEGSRDRCMAILMKLGDEAIPPLILALDHRTRRKPAALVLTRLMRPAHPGR